MAVGVKILLACLLATHVASQVLANSVLAKQYSQEVKHGILQTSESMEGMMYSSTVVLYVSAHQLINTADFHFYRMFGNFA